MRKQYLVLLNLVRYFYFRRNIISFYLKVIGICVSLRFKKVRVEAWK